MGRLRKRRAPGPTRDIRRREPVRYHTATRARQHSGASGEQGVPRGSRRRHPELRLPALRHWRRLRHSSRRRPPCSTTTISKSSPTSSAPTRLSPTPIRGWWPWHDSRHVAALAGHEHRLGRGDRHSHLLHRPRFRRAGCRCLAPAYGGWSPRRTHRWRHADGDHLHPAAEHHWRGRTVDGLCLVGRRRQSGVCALHGRLLLLHEGRQLATRTTATRISAQGLWENRTAQPSGSPYQSLVFSSG